MHDRVVERFKLEYGKLEQFCRRWNIVELAVFGSVLRDDFADDSDVDVLVTFASDATWSLLDWADMIDELEALFGRPVDMVEKEGLRNPFRRKVILSSAEVVYAAA
ncbi:MAG: DNA polymerase subunit beta [Deltaproteobacteria bacterium]|nr:DNA polymerase subunit beta [Deltaproteobacteria bacterium]